MPAAVSTSAFKVRTLYISPVAPFAYDRAAILRTAWTMARRRVELDATMPMPAAFRSLKLKPLTLRSAFADYLREVWDRAKSERGYALWSAEKEAAIPAEAARRAALPVRERRIEDARTALMFAEHNDTNQGHALVAAARAHLVALQAGA